MAKNEAQAREAAVEVFHKAPVPKAVLKNVLPAMAAQVMVVIYNLADTFFIGQTHDALQIAGVSLVMPIFLIFLALGTLFGIGGTSVISRALGEKRFDYAAKVCSFCMWGCIGLGAAVTILFLVFADGILRLGGASAETLPIARQYYMIVMACGPFSMLSNCYSNIIRAEGKSTVAMAGQIAGNLLNVILDPIMILVFNWQVVGAAIATVIGNVAAAGYYIIFFLRGKSILSIRPRDCSAKDGIASGVLAIGIPAAIGFLLMSIASIVLDSRLVRYNDMAMAGMGVACKIGSVAAILAMGIGQGAQPLFGYCVGAKLWKRYRKSFFFALCFALICCGAYAALGFCFARPLVCAFLTQPQAIEYGVAMTKILQISAPLIGALYVATASLQGMGISSAAMIVNVSRQGVLYIPLLFLMESVFGLYGLFWAQTVADSIVTIVAFALLAGISARQRRTGIRQEEA